MGRLFFELVPFHGDTLPVGSPEALPLGAAEEDALVAGVADEEGSADAELAGSEIEDDDVAGATSEVGADVGVSAVGSDVAPVEAEFVRDDMR